MENYPQLVTLVVLIPLIGMTINLFSGGRFGEKVAAIIGTTAALLAFVVAVLLWSYLSNSGYQSAVVNPPLLDGWIRIGSANVEIPWQMRVDTLSVTMMLVVTGVGSLIHIYAAGYMHGDPRFSRFFTYLNLFLTFMLILVTGNNFLMMFVGWEGVGLCSFLLIGFWFDRPNGVGWKNSLAARKAMIVNRIGDFGLLMAIFLMFWTFGTLDYFRPGEVTNVEYTEHHAAEAEHAAQEAAEREGAPAVAEVGHEGEAATAVEGEHTTSESVAAPTDTKEGEATAEEGHGEGAGLPVYTNNEHIETPQLGVFGQAERMIAEHHEVDFGPFKLPIETVLVLITLFMLVGAAGKSAQIPLFVWLPDAMAGPTPVSALIHAATMVTAGVYMMVRSNVFYHNAEFTSAVVAIIGALTAVVAGYIAIGQWDIKRVLAYSTISQLGFMVAAVGVGAYSAAMFHLITHAFFKALLFLGSGSVIHGMEHGHHLAHERAGHGHGHGHDEHDAHDAHGHDEHDEHHDDHDFDPQDMRNMGGLARRMPLTFITYLIGTLALAGIWPFAGFWSKDEILANSWLDGLVNNHFWGYFVLAFLIIAAACTAFYMWRQIEMVFFGQPRTEAADHAPESAPSMVIPLLVLGFLSLFGGMLNVPPNAGAFTIFGLFENLFGAEKLTLWLEPSVANAHAVAFQPLIAIGALVLAIGAIILARSIYGAGKSVTQDNRDPLAVRRDTAPAWNFANARMYWDETYYRLFENPFNVLSRFLANTLDWDFWHDYVHNTVIAKGFNAIGQILARGVDLGIIDGIVNGIGALVRWISGRVRNVQTGYVRTYAVTFLLGVVLVIVLLLLPALTNAGK